MALFSGFLERRRLRESAPSAGDPGAFGFPREPESPEPANSNFAREDQPVNASGGPGPEEIVDLLRMVSTALRTGQFQIHQTEAVDEPPATGSDAAAKPG